MLGSLPKGLGAQLPSLVWFLRFVELTSPCKGVTQVWCHLCLVQPIDPGIVCWISLKSLLQCWATFSADQISLVSVLIWGEVLTLWAL